MPLPSSESRAGLNVHIVNILLGLFDWTIDGCKNIMMRLWDILADDLIFASQWSFNYLYVCASRSLRSLQLVGLRLLTNRSGRGLVHLSVFVFFTSTFTYSSTFFMSTFTKRARAELFTYTRLPRISAWPCLWALLKPSYVVLAGLGLHYYILPASSWKLGLKYHGRRSLVLVCWRSHRSPLLQTNLMEGSAKLCRTHQYPFESSL